jgi:UDP-N-acetylmuramoylalanine--D-glutamate ligase
VADGKPEAELNAACVRDIRETGASVVPAFAELAQLGPLDLLVLSPGVPLDAEAVQEAQAAGVRITGEVELGYRFCPAPIVAIAGTNAKGSTCTLTGGMLERSGVRARVTGNIGDPFTGAVASGEPVDVYVLEISSFQLETIEHFRPRVACLLNITDDHLDRHGSLTAYVAAKARLFENQTAEDWAIANADDANAMRAVEGVRSRFVRFSARHSGTEARLEGDELVVNPGDGDRVICQRADLIRAGAPYIETVLAASSAALLAGSTLAGIREAIREHKLPAEVLEFVCEVNGIRFVNSSKATNPAAAMADLESVEGPVLLIAGGLERGADFAAFGRLAAQRAKGLFLIGQCAARIAEAAPGVPAVFCRTVEEAVQQAYLAGTAGDTVLLAPACASWDMFPDYKVRAACFREAARRLCAPGAKEAV